MTGGTARVLRGAQWPYRLAVDTLLVAGLCAVVAVLLSATVVRGTLRLRSGQEPRGCIATVTLLAGDPLASEPALRHGG